MFIIHLFAAVLMAIETGKLGIVGEVGMTIGAIVPFTIVFS